MNWYKKEEYLPSTDSAVLLILKGEERNVHLGMYLDSGTGKPGLFYNSAGPINVTDDVDMWSYIELPDGTLA